MSVKTESYVDRNEEWDLVIQPNRKLFELNIREIWFYRDLLWMFVMRDMITTYKQTVLGPLWFFVQPVMTMIVFAIVFGGIAKIGTAGVPSPLFYLSGIIIWNYFQDCFLKTSSTFTVNSGIFGKVYFPRLLVPFSQVTSGLIRFSIQLVLFLMFLVFYALSGERVGANLLVLVSLYCVVLTGILGMGLGIIFSSLTTKYRDLTFLVSFGVQLLMYASPIIYPVSAISGHFKLYMWWNPMSHLIEAFRYGFLGVGELSIIGLVYSSLFTLLVLVLGVIVFKNTEKNFLDTV